MIIFHHIVANRCSMEFTMEGVHRGGSGIF